MVRLAAVLVCLIVVAGCQQTTADKSEPVASTSTTTESTSDSGSQVAESIETDDQSAATTTTTTETETETETVEDTVDEPVVETQQAALTVEPLVYEESFTFDWDMSQKLRQGEGEEVVLLTPEGVSLDEIPEQLDRWLSRVKENGGFVKATPAPKEGEERSRFLVGAMIDVLLYLLGIVKEEVTFSPADDYNAVLFFEEESGQVERIVFFPKT